MAFITLRAMVKKDLQLFFSDRRAVIMGFAAPILIASFFGSLFGASGNSGEPARIAIMIADQDNGVISRSIIAAISTDKSLAVTRRRWRSSTVSRSRNSSCSTTRRTTPSLAWCAGS